jgi:predicted MPP superfamily phosphohydrolase
MIVFFVATLFLSFMPGKTDSPKIGTVNQNQKQIFTFGIIADVQYADQEPSGTRYYRSSLTKLKESYNTFKNNSAEFIINLGDIIDSDYASYKPVLDIIELSGIQTFHITGNHDYAVDSSRKKYLPVFDSSKSGYYSAVYNNYRFIFLNGNEISTYVSSDKEVIKQAEDYILTLKNKGEPNAIEWNGGIGNTQLMWMKDQLDEATRKNEYVFIICHFPVFPVNVHNLLNYREVLDIIEKYTNIIAWFSGHNHSGNYGYDKLTHFVTFKGMVETESDNSYSLVTVYKNSIQIKGYGREKSQILKY